MGAEGLPCRGRLLELVVALRLEWVTVGGCEAIRAMKTGVGVTNEYLVGFTLVISG